MDKEDILFGLSIFIVILIFIGVMIGGIYLLEKNITCPRYADSVGLESKYNFWAGGCFVNYQGQWIPSDNLRAGKLD